MAEKITQRKEYRGLGYAPAISVPGLIQTRPVAATRPPQTNELTKLAKSLSNFGETFGNAQLRKAAVADEEAKVLAKEALASRAMGGGGAKGGVDVRAVAFSGTNEELQKQFESNLIPKEATPAFYAYLRRGMAQSIASDYAAGLTARIKEAAVIGGANAEDVNNSALIEQIQHEESNKIQEKFGKDWFLYAPEAATNVDQEFANAVHGQLLKNREEEANETFKKNFSDVLERAGSIEKLDEYLAALVLPARKAGLPIKPLIAEASVNAVQKLLHKDSAGATAAARNLVDKLSDAVLPVDSKKKPQGVDSLLKGVNRKAIPESTLQGLAQQVQNWAPEELPEILKTLDQQPDSLNKTAVQQMIQNRIDYTPSRQHVRLLNEEADRVLDDMLEKAELRDRANRENDITTLNRHIKEEMDAWSVSPEGRNATPDQAFAKMKEILSMSFSLGRMDAEGEPIMASPSEFDKTIFRPDRWRDDVLNWRRVSQARGELNDWADKSIRGDLNKLTEEGIKTAKATLEANRASFTTNQVQLLEKAIKDAELISTIDTGVGRQRWADEVEGLTEILANQAGLSLADLAGLDPKAGPAIALQRRKVETLTKFRRHAQKNFREALAKHQGRPDENTLRELTEQAISDARETVTTELTSKDAVETAEKGFKDAEEARVAGFADPIGPNVFTQWFRESYTGRPGLDRRSAANMEKGRKLVAQIGGKGTLASRLAAMPNRARAGALEASLKKVKEENTLIRDAAWQRRYALTQRLSTTDYTDDKARNRDMLQLRRDLIHTGVTPEEVISKTIWQQKRFPWQATQKRQPVMLEMRKFGDEVALLNYATTPMFRDIEELKKLSQDGTTIDKMMKSLGIEPELQLDFLSTQILLIKSRGGGKGLLGKRDVKKKKPADMSGIH